MAIIGQIIGGIVMFCVFWSISGIGGKAVLIGLLVLVIFGAISSIGGGDGGTKISGTFFPD